MSTRIDHGYRLADGTDVLTLCETLRELFNPIRDRLDADALMSRAVGYVDVADRAGTPRPTNPLADALAELDDQVRDRSRPGTAHDPNGVTVCFGRDPGTGATLALLYAEAPEYRDAWESLPQVSEYGYWNSTDRPRDVSADAWAERAAAWDRLLPRHAPPSTRTVTFTLRAVPDIGTMRLAGRCGDTLAEQARLTLLREAAPPLRHRARSLAIDLLTGASRSDAADGGGADETLRTVTRLVFTRPGDPDNYEAVIDACAEALHDDAVDHALSGRPDTPITRPLDLTRAHAAVHSHLARTAATKGR